MLNNLPATSGWFRLRLCGYVVHNFNVRGLHWGVLQVLCTWHGWRCRCRCGEETVRWCTARTCRRWARSALWRIDGEERRRDCCEILTTLRSGAACERDSADSLPPVAYGETEEYVRLAALKQQRRRDMKQQKNDLLLTELSSRWQAALIKNEFE